MGFTLQVGAIEQTVEVTGEAPLVNTTSGTLGSLMENQQILDLPLEGRNYINLTLLQPGVVQFRQRVVSISSGTWISVNGAPPRSNYFTMDGAPMTNYTDGSTSSVGGSTLGVEAIREWRMVTNLVSAEYGMRMGGQMVIVSKSGTNEWHGSIFEYFRNSNLDARNFFDYTTPTTPFRLPPLRRNQFGGAIGGPIKQDKIFIFSNYEALIERLGDTKVSTTIADGCKGAAGTVITNEACSQLGGRGAGNNYAGDGAAGGVIPEPESVGEPRNILRSPTPQ